MTALQSQSTRARRMSAPEPAKPRARSAALIMAEAFGLPRLDGRLDDPNLDATLLSELGCAPQKR